MDDDEDPGAEVRDRDIDAVRPKVRKVGLVAEKVRAAAEEGSVGVADRIPVQHEARAPAVE